MIRNRYSIVALIFIVLTLVQSAPLSPAQASVASCTASVTPHTVPTSTGLNLTFTLNNTSTVETAVWVKITRPSTHFIVNGFSASDWSGSYSSSDVTLTGTLSPLQEMTAEVAVVVDSEEASAADWIVSVSDSGGGDDPTTCSGNLGVAINDETPDPTDTAPPIISDITVSGISSSSATISWNTDESANATVYYGPTTNYASTAQDVTPKTAHTLTLTGLSANTTYHYKVRSQDAADNIGESSDNTLVTAAATATATTSTTTTPTPTPTAIPGAAPQPKAGLSPDPTATPTPGSNDRSAPSVTITTDMAKPYTNAPLISGRAVDNVGVSRIQYSTDNGRNWLPPDTVKGLGSTAASFAFTPLLSADDNYLIFVRAFDGSNNVGISQLVTLIIDRLPPHVGPVLYSFGAQPLDPDEQGNLLTMAGLEQRVTLSTIGGPTTVDLVSSKQVFSLVKNIDTGLWSGVISFAEPGSYELTARLVDGGGAKVEETLSRVVVVDAGRMTQGSGEGISATITLYYFNPLTKTFVLWDARPFGQQNPQATSADGRFVLWPPPGTYYLTARAPGYRSLQSHIFSLSQSLPINSKLNLAVSPALALGPWRIPLPSFGPVSGRLTVQYPKVTVSRETTSLLGSELPFLALGANQQTFYATGLKGKPSVVSLLATWLPQTTEQVSHLQDLMSDDIHVMALMSQEGESAVAIWKKRGQYTLPMVADPAGQFMQLLQQHHVPTHLILDRQGTIRAIRSGVLSTQELQELVQHVAAQ